MVKRANTIEDLERKKFDFIELPQLWFNHLGEVERTGSTLIMGDSGHGKTAYSLQMAKAFCLTQKVHYNSVEEGTGATFRRNTRKNNMNVVRSNFQYSKEPYDIMIERLNRKRQPKIVFIDSIQYCFRGKKGTDYHKMIEMFPTTHFVGISHIEKGKVKGAVANEFYWDCQNRIIVKDWKAYLDKSRCGGNEIEPYIINEQKAAEREMKLLKKG